MFKVNDFKKDLKFSDDDSNNPAWDIIRNELFPGWKIETIPSGVNGIQKSGVDEILSLGSKTIWIDRKVRRKRHDDRIYNDVLIETVSNDNTQSPGWAVKESSKTDIILYYNQMTEKCLCFNLPALRKYYHSNPDIFKNKHIFSARNNGYKTLNVSMTIDELSKIPGIDLRIVDVKQPKESKTTNKMQLKEYF